MTVFNERYRGASVLLTGHTGFKGSWMGAWLTSLGAKVSGYSLAPKTEPAHSELVAPLPESFIADIADRTALAEAFEKTRPEIIFHLAAQASVLSSYADPTETFRTNVIGTANVLDMARQSDATRAVVIVTTDKCYEDKDQVWGYRETDALGGRDPYAASKACAEIVTRSYRDSFLAERGILVASARAGNVIGGGDWTADRIVPDIARATARGEAVGLRNPGSSRPWQHVLEPLAGYLLLGQKLLEGDNTAVGAWNFGCSEDAHVTVGALVERLRRHWPDVQSVASPRTNAPYEASQLLLDSSKAIRKLGWRPVWDLDSTLRHTAQWYRSFTSDGLVMTLEQISGFVADARSKALPWAS